MTAYFVAITRSARTTVGRNDSWSFGRVVEPVSTPDEAIEALRRENKNPGFADADEVLFSLVTLANPYNEPTECQLTATLQSRGGEVRQVRRNYTIGPEFDLVSAYIDLLDENARYSTVLGLSWSPLKLV